MIGVVIVTYDGEYWIRRCLNTLINSAASLSVLVIDNCSKDGTCNIIKTEFKDKVQLVALSTNLGFGKANNIGIKQLLNAGCDYISLVNQDAYISGADLEYMARLSEENKEYGVLSPIHLKGDGEGLDYYFSGYIDPKSCDLFSDVLLKKKIKCVYNTSFVNAALWLIRSDVFKENGGFDPLFTHYGEDLDWVYRLTSKGYKVGICPEIFAIHDRPQIQFGKRNLNFKKRINQCYVGELVKLKRSNHSIFFNYWMVTLNLLKTIVAKVVNLNKDFLVYLVVLIKVISKFVAVYENRQICQSDKKQIFL